MSNDDRPKLDFIRTIVDDDLRAGRHQQIVTRFPPEPNGFLHIGHAKSICLNFGIAEETGGRYHLRFDDTNPTKEEQRYIDSIQEDVRWLGFDWGEHLYFASDYFERLYELAVQLIDDGLAYVCDLSGEEIRSYRGTLTEPGRNSPDRDRSVAENRDLFARMRAGEYPDGSRTLRAKIDMASGNLNLRDPVMYRILHATHPRTGDAWCIYPTYDWAHGQSDAIERITHSICTLEFEGHRPLYDWFVTSLGFASPPRQIEFARLNLTHTVMSKRTLLKLVTSGAVRGWDDPRMPTLSGLRRRGYTPEAIRSFCDMIGVAKRNSQVDLAQLEFAIRDDLNRKVRRVMGVLGPLKVVITNFPAEGRGRPGSAVLPGQPRPDGLAKGAVHPRAVHRPQRLPIGAAEEVLPPRTRPRGASALGLLHPLHRRHHGPRHRRGRGAPVHLRPHDARRQTPRTGARSRAPSTGCRPSTPSRPRSDCTNRFSPSRSSPKTPPTSSAT